jgi:hypothetical protein
MSAETPMSEKEWEATWDAETLARAEEIKSDKPRLNAAQKAALTMTEKKREEAAAMAKVAGKKERPTGGQQGHETNPFNVGQRLNK